MTKEKEILRLRSLGMSQKAIMSIVHCASGKMKSTYEKADEFSITYELIKDKTDDEIDEIFNYNIPELNIIFCYKKCF